jgi:hypothetical protein
MLPEDSFSAAVLTCAKNFDPRNVGEQRQEVSAHAKSCCRTAKKFLPLQKVSALKSGGLQPTRFGLCKKF